MSMLKKIAQVKRLRHQPAHFFINVSTYIRWTIHGRWDIFLTIPTKEVGYVISEKKLAPNESTAK